MEKTMRTSCLTDDEIACLSTGLLDEDERAAAEQHLDGCPGCSRLIADLGRAFGQTSLTESDFVLMGESAAWSKRGDRWRRLPALAKLQLSQALVLLAAGPLLGLTEGGSVLWRWGLVWCLLLALWSVINGVSLSQQRPWAVPSTRLAAVFALLSGITAVHGVYTWYLLEKHSSQ
jgi:anti-sigma factor RsiW